ncbi:hypothetical protein DEU56DRAFT_814143 [Suillus clintonianus]|uniref:uncharacterized protein n=1 Tax=Suillus clintonianus TaxID=1904413 RepID=UPI001B86F754|nr:uncharacterized protein DEU56DRAFT_814143 [Suillus clintonianus]KAG2131366.1 hypothetical protein DEU56DRAFT_814143 [Suillus clintonianus]
MNTSAFSHNLAVHSAYEDLVVLFGWDLKLLWWTLLGAGRFEQAAEFYRNMMDMSDGSMEADYAFTQECSKLCVENGDAAFDANNYGHAIGLYSAAIKLDSANDGMFAKRSKAKLGNMLWEEALIDAQKVIELNPSSYFGHQLKHAALHGAKRYDEAIDAFRIMLSKIENATDTQIRSKS